MVAGRAYATKRRGGTAFENEFGREYRRACGMVYALEFLGRRSACLDVQQMVVQMLDVEGIRDTRQPLRTFRMAVRNFMAVKYRVINQRCCHVQSLPRSRSRK